MRIIYIDSEKHCHPVNDGTMVAVETDYFDGKCDEYVEGYFYDVDNGILYPWKLYSELDNAQRQYEQELIADMKNALAKLGVTVDE